MQLRTNRLKEKHRTGQPVLGTWLMLLRNPECIAQLSDAGYDYLRLDMEHTQISLEKVALLAAVARAQEIELQVRVPSNERRWIEAVLDAGVWNLVIPQIETADQARRVVEYALHGPTGARGTFEPGPQNDYVREELMPDELGHANANVQITVMLESKRAFDNIEEIVAVEGIDAFTTGRADLAQDLDIYTSYSKASQLDPYEKRLLEVVSAAGKIPASGAWDAEELHRKLDAGYREIFINTDTTFIRQEFVAFRQALANAGENHAR